MQAIFNYFQQFLPPTTFGYQPAMSRYNSENGTTKMTGFQNFFVAKDFSKQASYFFRVDSSQEYVAEKEELKKERRQLSTKDLKYSVGLKRIGKILVFPLVFCWIILETAFEIIVDSDEDEVTVAKEKVIEAPKGNSYQRPEI